MLRRQYLSDMLTVQSIDGITAQLTSSSMYISFVDPSYMPALAANETICTNVPYTDARLQETEIMLVFFFSSRRRHTRFDCDWSSDVCSSDLVSDNWELELPHGVQPVDGVEGARLAVREQVAHGADWIKFYSDRRYYFGPGPD